MIAASIQFAEPVLHKHYLYHLSPLTDLLFALDTTADSVKSITVSVSEEIGEEGGMVDFHSSEVSLYVSEGTVPPSTSFSLKSYVDPRVLPPLTSKSEVTLSPAFQLSSSLPQGYHPFKKPLQLSLLPEVPLSTSNRDNGWLLQLKRSETSDGLPDEWHTMLEINTMTGEVISHSSNSLYDPKSHAVYLYQLPWLSWIGKPLETVGSVVGSSSSSISLREINYAVFGKQIQHYKWLIAAHIIHKSEVVYKLLVEKLKRESYVQLNHPHTDCIGPNGKVCLQVQCKVPWQVQQGKPEVHIQTSRIWGSEQDASCYHEFTVEDHTCLADTLEFTIGASFHAQGGKDAECPVQLIISRPLCESQPRTPATGTVHVLYMQITMSLRKFAVVSESDMFCDAQLVLSAVLKHGPHCWFSIGLKLGFTAGQVKAITHAIPRDEDKLTMLFETKANALGRDKAAAQLLDACNTITNPILGIVMDELKCEC